MDYTPRYTQPYTFLQATQLDVPIIVEEIKRLQHSLKHLKATQTELQEIIVASGTPDTDLTDALVENKDVINSQEERVRILHMALTHKGVHSASANHYALDPATHPFNGSPNHDLTSGVAAAPVVASESEGPRQEEEADDGVYL